MNREEMKSLIANTITSTLRNPKKTALKPIIAELERMLNVDEPPKVEILPDGSVTSELPVYASTLAEEIVRVLGIDRTCNEITNDTGNISDHTQECYEQTGALPCICSLAWRQKLSVAFRLINDLKRETCWCTAGAQAAATLSHVYVRRYYFVR